MLGKSCTLLSTSIIALLLTSCSTPKVNKSNSWIAIDTFEQTSLHGWTKADTANNTIPYTENPQVTELKAETNNQYMIKKPAKDGLVGNRKALTYKALPTSVNVGETYTFFSRINVEYFPNNHAFGISNQSPQDIETLGYDAFEPTLRVTDKAESSGLKNDGALMVKTDNGYSNVQNFAEKRSAKPLVEGQWYDIWTVVNNDTVANGGQSYDVYVKGGEFSEQTLVYEGAQFRKKRELPLIYFLMNCNTGPHKKPYGNGGLQYDDLYMAKGINLTLP
ncbi:hypothetical protein CWS31_016060 [Colwellia echini]|uniref:Polysaccharide lyase family 7 protein n=2 Tax=Colwellia echini TaxID=1982103 RepID=A0ABY3MT49_9GAMM|nr:hypothetical protein [Colwellia echini]TYK64382.1 hypothetical protein CWS31_016060 [Colwellia echini]